MLRDLIRGFERGGQNKNMGHRALRGKSWSKRGPRSYYKGRGARSLGSINSKGRFRYNPEKLPVLVVPELDNFDLKPYVAQNTPKITVKPPTLPKLDLSQAEVDILDIVAPQHKAWRLKKKLDEERQAALELNLHEQASDAATYEENRTVEASAIEEHVTAEQGRQVEEAEVLGEKRARE